jgi:hypothetical protein
MTQPRWERKQSQTISDDRTEFTGTESYEHAMNFVQRGWKEGRSKLVKGVETLALKKELASVPAFVYDVAGACPEVPLAVAGDPCCMWDANPLQDAKAPVLRFVVDVAASCQWTVEQLIRWGTAILSVVDSLEANGQCSVELSAAITIVDSDDRRRLEFLTKIKEAGQHVDFDVVAFAIAHPSMLRRIGFACCERICADAMENHMTEGYGRPGRLSPETLDGAYYVPSVNFSGIPSSLLRSDAQSAELFDAVMKGFRRLVEGQPFSSES